jgi:hypothetical protein
MGNSSGISTFLCGFSSVSVISLALMVLSSLIVSPMLLRQSDAGSSYLELALHYYQKSIIYYHVN